MSQALTVFAGSLDNVLMAWLAEHMQSSRRTAQTYGAMVAGWSLTKEGWTPTRPNEAKAAIAFRDFLRSHGCDLDAGPQQIALLLQAWAALSNSQTAREVAASTYNMRLTSVSSLYNYMIRHDVYVRPDGTPNVNPADRVKRRSRQMYTGAHPLQFKNGEIESSIMAISDSTPSGRRDKAALLLALYTGRRLAEIANLTTDDIEIEGGVWRITFHAKGGKVMHDALKESSKAVMMLRKWLHSQFGKPFPRGMVVFPSFHRGHEGQPMDPWSWERNCAKHLGTHKFHALRHTFAAVYLANGGTVQGLSKRLGHSSLAVTTHYVETLGDDVNELLDDMEAMLGGRKREA